MSKWGVFIFTLILMTCATVRDPTGIRMTAGTLQEEVEIGKPWAWYLVFSGEIPSPPPEGEGNYLLSLQVDEGLPPYRERGAFRPGMIAPLPMNRLTTFKMDTCRYFHRKYHEWDGTIVISIRFHVEQDWEARILSDTVKVRLKCPPMGV